MVDEQEAPANVALSRWGVLGGILAFSLRRVRYRWLAVPVVVAVVTALIIDFTQSAPGSIMSTAEVLAIVILSVALGVIAWRWRRERHLFLGWLTGLVALLLFREIHIYKSSLVVEILLPIVVFLAARWYFRMAGYFASSRTLTILVLVFATYTLTETLDNHAFEFIPNEDYWERPTEETLELLGHLFVLLLTITARADARPLVGSWSPPRLQNPSCVPTGSDPARAADRKSKAASTSDQAALRQVP